MNDNNPNPKDFYKIDDFEELYKIKINKPRGWQTFIDYKLLDLAKEKEISFNEMKFLFDDYYFCKLTSIQWIFKAKHKIIRFVRYLYFGVKNIVLVAGFIAIIIPLFTFLSETSETLKEQKKKDLLSYANYGEYLKQYGKVQSSMSIILNSESITVNNVQIKLINKINAENTANNQFYFRIIKFYDQNYYDLEGNYINGSEKKRFNRTCQKLINATNSKTTSELYYSNNTYFKNYRKIHAFYETLGTAIKQKVVEFNNVFDLFSYPAYWEDDIKASEWASFDPFFEIEKCVKNNWFGEGNALIDFSDNFLQLGTNYHYERIKLEQKKLDCEKIGKQEPTPTLEKKEKCKYLKMTKKKIEENHCQNSSRLRLYKLYNPPKPWYCVFSFFPCCKVQ